MRTMLGAVRGAKATWCRLVAISCVLGASLGSVGCAGESGFEGLEPEELEQLDVDTGTITLDLTTVPPAALCIRLTATTPAGTATVKTFAVTAGSSSASLAFGKLAPGSYSLTGDAFNVACGSISGAGDWIADTLTVTIRVGVTSNATLTFRRNNPLTASANFVNNVVGVGVGFLSSYVATEQGMLQAGLINGSRTFTRATFPAFEPTSAGNAPRIVAP